MYDELIYFDPISEELFLVRFYLDNSYEFENLPERLHGIKFILSSTYFFDDWLEDNQCVAVGSSGFKFNEQTKFIRVKHREGFISDEEVA